MADSGLSTISFRLSPKRLGLLYVIVSVICFASYWIPVANHFVEAYVALLFFWGPPAWLVYGYHYLIAYFLGTMVCLPAFAAAAFLRRGYYKKLFLVAGILAWIVFGFMAAAVSV